MDFDFSHEEVFNIIKEKINLKLPFLILRIGDGEGFVIEKNKILSEKVLYKHTGMKFNENETEIIRKNLIEAINSSDLIGVHDINLPGNFGKSFIIANEFCDIKNIKKVPVGFPYSFLKKWEYKKSKYDEFLENLEELFIISGRSLDKGFEKRFNIKKVKTFIIPPEFAYEMSHNEMKPHFPDRFYEIKNEIENLGDLRGKLLLYGAGIIGKIYGLFWKNQGGIAIDLGSVFDFFAGKITRGKDQGRNAVSLTYKL